MSCGSAYGCVGTTSGRKDSIQLMGSHLMKWRHYSNVEAPKHGEFRYLAVQVKPR